ncbi:phage portal protein [Streptomyces bauhiniae]|uniref:phage portal protein n=1 Tax=Streptomyces bauhiniae TaxID=2340725 RepID=UPI0033B7A6B6
MPRHLLPAWRGLFVPRTTTAPTTPVQAETKDLAFTGGYASVTYAGVTNVWGTPGRADGWDLERVIIEGYERSIWTFKAVEAISKHAGALPIQIGRGGDESRFEETLDSHPLLKLLNKKANPLESGDVFKKRLSAQLLLSKKGVFIEKTYSRAGILVRFDLLPPDRVRIIPDDENGDYVKHFEFTNYRGQVRILLPKHVIWIRDPHPHDPFSGITPLEAAGLSVDLDVKARTYNISFIDRDARPSGIVGIDLEGVSDPEIDRLQRRFAPGAHQAGELALVGTGKGGITYVDTSTRPRDMAYETLSNICKGEILAAFGVPESVVGNASERTYANADREEWTFWDHTELPHLSLVASGFDDDLDDEWVVRFDTQRVQALEYPRRVAREEARKEFEAGLISVDEYRDVAKKPRFNTAQSRALWISPQKAPIAANDADAAALGLTQAGPGGPGATPTGAPLPEGAPVGSAADDVAAASGAPSGLGDAAADLAAARAQQPPTGATGVAADAVAAARVADTDTGPGSAAADVAAASSSQNAPAPGPAAAAVNLARETKALPQSPERTGFEVTDDDFDTLAAAVTAALAALLEQQEGVIVARLRAPKTRKHTRFWQPEFEHDTRGGDASLDQDRVVSADRWATEVVTALAPILQQAAVDTARKVGRALTGTDTVTPAAAAAAIASAAFASQAVSAFLADLAEVLKDTQQGPVTLDGLVDAVGGHYEAAKPALIERIAETCAVATINGAADAAAEHAGPGVVRTWVTRGDNRVRPAHKALNGKTLPVGTPYTVDGASLRYPGDPFAPVSLTINCRCRLRYNTEEE